MDKYTQDVAALGELTINDTAANNYITILVNTGILGLTSYLVFVILQLINGIKTKNITAKIFLIAFISYLIQDFFNLWVVVVTPLFWVLIAILYISTKEMGERNENNI